MIVIAVAVAVGVSSTTAHAQSWQPPADNQRCPSKWGAADQRGAANHLSEIGQVGTQFDGFSHQTIGDSMDNCYKVDDTATRTGFTKLGVENVGALVPRGVLIDVAASKGAEMLPDTYEITVADLQQALQRQNLTLQPWRPSIGKPEARRGCRETSA